jgi:hypothetical protein
MRKKFDIFGILFAQRTDYLVSDVRDACGSNPDWSQNDDDMISVTPTTARRFPGHNWKSY